MPALAAAAPYIALAASGVQAIGALTAGEAQKAQADVEASLAQAQAAQEELRTAEEEKLRRRDARRLIGRQRAGFAGAGVITSAGTPLLVMAETLLEAEEDVEAIRAGGSARASAFRNRAVTFREVGKSRQTAGRFRAGASLLSGLGTFFGP